MSPAVHWAGSVEVGPACLAGRDGKLGVGVAVVRTRNVRDRARKFECIIGEA